MSFEAEIAASVAYLDSSEAIDCLAEDTYLPKWDAHWWHMLLLHEMGHTSPMAGGENPAPEAPVVRIALRPGPERVRSPGYCKQNIAEREN